MIRRHVWISGRVQGVNFRNAMKQVADQLRVAGWVRNLPDRRVEAVLEGPKDAMQQLLTWCTRGPPAAQVEKVDVSQEPASGEFHQFRVLREPAPAAEPPS